MFLETLGEVFREKLLKESVAGLDAKEAKRADGYYGEQLQGHGERRARAGILLLPYNGSRKTGIGGVDLDGDGNALGLDTRGIGHG